MSFYAAESNFGSSQQQFGSPQQGGGGFMNNEQSFGGSPVSMSQKSPGSGGNAGKKRDAQSLIPLTVKQLLEAEQKDSKFKVDGRPISQVTILGQILSVETQSTNVNYLIDDGTGKVNVRIYIDSEDENSSTTWNAGTYVRVVGNLRSFNDKKSVVGFQLIPVTDFNEVTFHYLNVIATHLRFTKQPGNNTPAKISGSTSSFGQPQAQPMQMQQQGGVPPMQALDADGKGFTAIQQQILQVFKSGGADDETGLSVDAVFAALSGVPQGDIRESLSFLSDEGHLYTTIDENHFKSTDE